jgi:type I restriction enzyme S subunit
MTSKAVHEWIPTKLGDIIKIKHGFAFKGEFFSETPTDNILVTPGNFNIGGGFKNSKFKYYAGEIPQEYILNVDDVIVTMTDLSKAGDTLGYSAKVPSIVGKKLLHNQRIGLLQFTNKVNQDFIYWLLRTKNYQNLILGSATGSTVKHTSPNRICEFEFELPSLNEQERIANILSSLDNKITLNREMNKTLEAMAQAIFKSWFVDFEPFQEGEFVESELGMIPKGWEIGQLGDNIKIIDNRGKTPPICTKITEYPIIEVNALSGDNRTVNYSAIKKYVSEETYNSWFRAGHPKKNDILLSTVGSVGEVAMFPDNRGSIAQNVVALRAINTSPYYLYQALVNMKDKLKGLDIGSVQPSIKVTQMTKIHFLWPEQYVLEKFDSHIENLVQKIHLNETEIEALSQVRDTLLPKLLSGEIEV